jgi:PHD/YefM family antitoxin component YafN of YafNO toxin-antitoxin module
MGNTLSSAQLKRHGVAAIEQALLHGPVHILKRNKPAAVVMSEQAYRLLQQRAAQAQLADDSTALRWLLELPVAANPRTKDEIDAALAEERNW